MADLAWFVALVGVVLAAGLVVGMLVAPRLARLAEPPEPGRTAPDAAAPEVAAPEPAENDASDGSTHGA